MSAEQTTRANEPPSSVRSRLVVVDSAITLEDKIVAINSFRPKGFVSEDEFQRFQSAVQLLRTRQEFLAPQALTSPPVEPTEPQIEKESQAESEEKKVQYSPRERQFLDLYLEADTVSKSMIMSILREHMNRPPTSQDVQVFLQVMKRKLKEEEKELVNLTPMHSGEPVYVIAPLGTSDSLKPIRIPSTPTRLRDDEEPDFDDLPEIDDSLSFLSDLPEMTDYPGHITLFDRRTSRLPKQAPRREYTPNVVYRKTVAPSGREMNLRPQEFIIYTAIMAGRSQREIIDESFDGDESKFFNYFSGVATELNALGYNITSVLRHEGNEGTRTTYDIAPKIKQESQPKKEAPTIKYTALTDADIDTITNPRLEDRALTPEDVRVLVALAKAQDVVILVDSLARRMNPKKISGFSKEIASLPERIDFYNQIFLLGTPLRIHSKSDNNQDPEGYGMTSYPQTTLEEKIQILTRRIEQFEKANSKQDNYSIQVQNDHNGPTDLSITKNGEATRPITLKDIVFEDDLDAEGYKRANTVTYHLRASNQVRIVKLLFQSNPVATRTLRTLLADDKDGISQRELQLYIDALNGTLPEKDEQSGQGKPAGNNNNESLKKLGLCVIGTSFNNDPSITLARYVPSTFRPVNLAGQYDTTLMGEEAAKRQRKRKPSHAKLRL